MNKPKTTKQLFREVCEWIQINYVHTTLYGYCKKCNAGIMVNELKKCPFCNTPIIELNLPLGELTEEEKEKLENE